MISWRYHIVSIVAVVLALGLGILAGASVISGPFAEDLQRRYDTTLAERDEARARAAALSTYVEESASFLVDGALTGVDAVVVTAEGADDGVAARTTDALEAADARVVARLRLSAALGDPSAADRQALAEILGVPSNADVAKAAAEAIGERLVVGPRPRGPAAEADVLQALLDAGFLEADVPSGSLADVGGTGQIVVVGASGDAQTPADLRALLLDVLGSLVTGGRPAAAAEPAESTYGLVDAVRSDGDRFPTGERVTVDDVDLTMGAVALATGMQRLLLDPLDGGGDYGLDGVPTIPPHDSAPPSPVA